MMDEARIRDFVGSVSVGAVTYQARVLSEELTKITDREYPVEACEIRNVLLCLTEHIRGDLEALRPTCGGEDEVRDDRVRSLASILHEVYAYLRYLRASSAGQSPPGIQVALTQLTELHFPSATNGRPVCLVRPQWKYNLMCVALTWYLRLITSLSVLDPDGRLGVRGAEDILPAIWRKWRAGLQDKDKERIGEEPPQQLAVLSFAGLDTHDALLYPLLAHELGHFIDFSYRPPLHLQDPIRVSSQILTSL